MPLIDQDAFLAIRQNRWILDCIHMSLRRQSGGPERYVGGGAVRQTSHGELEFVLYDTNAEVSLQEIIPQIGVGEWLRAADFWTLMATDLYGHVWRAEWVDINPSTTYAHPGAIVRGSLDHITGTRETHDGGNSFGGFAPTSSRVPTNQVTEIVQKVDGRESKGFATNIWKVDCGSVGSLLVTQFDDGIDVELSHDENELPSQIGVRLEEGLTFALAAPINWLVEETTARGMHSVRVNSRSRVTGDPRLGPPLHLQTVEARYDTGLLLGRHLEYSLGHPSPEDERHPLAVSIAKVLRASGGTLEDESLALATEVEHIVRAYFADHGKSRSDFVATVADALRHFAYWSGPDDVRKRIDGALNGMTGSNPRTALKNLAAKGAISQRHVEAWEAIRHQAAHGLRSSKSVRETAAKNDLVYQMLLLLVFQVIGYAGRFTDYTTRGWPIVTPRECVQNPSKGGAAAAP